MYLNKKRSISGELLKENATKSGMFVKEPSELPVPMAFYTVRVKHTQAIYLIDREDNKKNLTNCFHDHL